MGASDAQTGPGPEAPRRYGFRGRLARAILGVFFSLVLIIVERRLRRASKRAAGA
jgi:hypothetical protein